MVKIILSGKVKKNDFITGRINKLLRIGEKNKWKIGTELELKDGFLDKSPIKAISRGSDYIKVTSLNLKTLKECGFSSMEEFKNYWIESWFQKWSEESFLWLIQVEVITFFFEEENTSDIENFFL